MGSEGTSRNNGEIGLESSPAGELTVLGAVAQVFQLQLQLPNADVLLGQLLLQPPNLILLPEEHPEELGWAREGAGEPKRAGEKVTLPGGTQTPSSTPTPLAAAVLLAQASHPSPVPVSQVTQVAAALPSPDSAHGSHPRPPPARTVRQRRKALAYADPPRALIQGH